MTSHSKSEQKVKANRAIGPNQRDVYHVASRIYCVALAGTFQSGVATPTDLMNLQTAAVSDAFNLLRATALEDQRRGQEMMNKKKLLENAIITPVGNA